MLAAAAGRTAPAFLGGRAGEARRASGARSTMSDTGGGKKPPVEPQAGPGPGPGRAAGERGLPGSFPLVLRKLMENPPREARLGEGGGRRVPGGGVLQGRGLMGAGPGGRRSGRSGPAAGLGAWDDGGPGGRGEARRLGAGRGELTEVGSDGRWRKRGPEGEGWW